MKRIHVLTTAGFIFACTGIVLMPSELPVLAPVYALLGYLCSIKEVSKYTSWYQFFTVFFSALVVGISVDKNWQTFPLLTITVVIAAAGSILRIVLFRLFCHTRYTWFEPVMLGLSIVLYFIANIYFPSGWQGWVFPLGVIFLLGVFTVGVLKDEKQLLGHKLGSNKIAIGKEAPDFELPDQDGNRVSLTNYISKRNLLLIFVRGDWCPGCHMMLRTYERESKKFQTKDILVIAIGPDPIGVNREMVLKLGLDFKVLSDPGQRTAMQYGVQLSIYENDFAEKYEEGIPLPASFLIDKKGFVQYVSRADRVGEFLDPRTIFPIIDKLSY
jgi:peroxiredoxin